MASTIAAITTGIGGIVTTADATGNLSLLSGTSTVVAVTSAGAAVTGTMSVSGATTLTGGLNTPLAVTSGGTGLGTLTANNVILGAGTSNPTFVAPSTTGNLLTSNGTTWTSAAAPAGGVTTFNGSTTGLTPATATSGAITLGGTLAVANGGTGVTTSTGTGATVRGTSPTLTTPTFDSASLATISGTAPLYMCRAWVNFNGAGTVAIRASGNVSSITDNGTGDYTVNFTTAMSDANYSVSGVCNLNTTGNFGDFLGGPFNQAPTTSAWRCLVVTYDGGTVDPVYATIAFFR